MFPADRVDFVERGVNAIRERGRESCVVRSGTEAGDETAGVVVALMNAGLIRERRPPEQGGTSLHEAHTGIASPQMRGDHAAVESAAENQYVAIAGHVG